MNKVAITFFVLVVVLIALLTSGCKFAIKDFTSAVGELTAETKTVK